jgi:hypothetical protein
MRDRECRVRNIGCDEPSCLPTVIVGDCRGKGQSSPKVKLAHLCMHVLARFKAS